MNENEKAKLILTDSYCEECDAELHGEGCKHHSLEALAFRLQEAATKALKEITENLNEAMNVSIDIPEVSRKKMRKNEGFVSHKDRYKSPLFRGIK